MKNECLILLDRVNFLSLLYSLPYIFMSFDEVQIRSFAVLFSPHHSSDRDRFLSVDYLLYIPRYW